MKIIHVICRLGGGGAEVVAINLATKQSVKNEVVVITLSPRNEAALSVATWQEKTLQDSGVTLIEFCGLNFKFNFPFIPFKLSKIFNEIKPDIVHSHTDRPDICVSLAKRVCKFKFNVARTIHNTKIWDTWWLPGFISESGFENDLIICISNDTAETYIKLRNKYNLKASQHQHIIINGVNAPSDSECLKKEQLEGLFTANIKQFQIAYFGRIAKQKGVDILIEAISKIRNEKAEFHIFGEGEDLPTLSTIVQKQNLPVKFHQPVAPAPDVMAAFDLIVMPSRFEGLGLVALEAQMASVPVLVADSPGLREAVRPNWPLMVPSEDPEALAAMISKVISGEYDLQQLQLEGKCFSEKFSVVNMAEQYEKAYDGYLSRIIGT